MTTDEKYMARCLQLARCGKGLTSPNPMVGCVIVHEDEIIGEGYHYKYGGPLHIHEVGPRADVHYT